MSSSTFKSARFLAEKQKTEIEEVVAEEVVEKRERRVLLGFFVISLLATLIISGALKLY